MSPDALMAADLRRRETRVADGRCRVRVVRGRTARLVVRPVAPGAGVEGVGRP